MAKDVATRLQRLWRRVRQSAGAADRLSLLPMLTTPSPPGGGGSQSKAKPLSPSTSNRLGDVVWKPEDEFPGRSTIDRSRLSLHREAQVLARIARAAMLGIFQPSRLALVGVCSFGVVGLSGYEAHLLLDPEFVSTSSESLRFSVKYAAENLLASCLWETRSAELIAQAMGIDPTELLRELKVETSMSDAALKLRIDRVATARCMVAGFMIVTQLLSIVRSSMLAALGYSDGVFAGKEPPLRGIQERIIRLAGDGSDVTEVSMARYGAHILPVYEHPAKVRHLVALWSVNGRVPCVWQVGAGCYGYRHSWAALEVDASYMLRTTTGKYILCIEADATNLDRAHDLQKPTNDVTIEDAAQAYRLIERSASLKLRRPFRSLCVFLGDAMQLCDTGGTSFVTIRERIKLKQEVHVLIDSKAPLLLEILKWCARFVDARKTIVLDVTPLNFHPLQLLLETNGYTVLTPAQAAELRASALASSPPTDKDNPATALLPRLVYYPTTAATINAVHASLTAGNVASPSQCCVLINSPFGVQHLDEIAAAEGDQFFPICAAEIYDDYFRQVRIWTRMGHSAADIQRELDARFAAVRDVQQAIASMERSSTTMKKL